MSLSGLCQVCESAEAEHACERCGAHVCEKHYDYEYDVCVQCASVLGEGDEVRDGTHDEPRVDDGRDDTGPGLGMR